MTEAEMNKAKELECSAATARYVLALERRLALLEWRLKSLELARIVDRIECVGEYDDDRR